MAFPAVHLQWKILLWAAPLPPNHLGNSKYPTQVPTSSFIEKGRTTQQWSKLQFNFQPVVTWKVCKTTHWKHARNKYGLFCLWMRDNVLCISSKFILIGIQLYPIYANFNLWYFKHQRDIKLFSVLFCCPWHSTKWTLSIIETWRKYTAQ